VFDATTVSEEVATLETVTGGLKPARSTKEGARDGSQATVQAITSDDICERKRNLILLQKHCGTHTTTLVTCVCPAKVALYQSLQPRQRMVREEKQPWFR